MLHSMRFRALALLAPLAFTMTLSLPAQAQTAPGFALPGFDLPSADSLFDRRGRGRGGRDDSVGDDRSSGGHGGRPRIPGGSGCDDPWDIIEHPECRR